MLKHALALPLLALLLLLPQTLSAQTWTSYINTDLVQLSIEAGDDIWSATSGGLVRYNLSSGSATVFTTANGLPSTMIFSMVHDRAGRLWVGTVAGLVSYDGSGWTRHSIELTGGRSADAIYALTLDSAGGIWATAGIPDVSLLSAIAHYDGNGWTVMEPGMKMPKLTGARMMTAPDGSLWLVGKEYLSTGDKSIVMHIDGDSVQLYRDGLPELELRSIAVDSSGTVWVGSGDGVARFDGTSWRTFIQHAEPQGLHTTGYALAVAPNGTLWVGGMSGVDSYRNGTWTHYTVDSGLASNYASSLIARGDTLWVGGLSGVTTLTSHGWTRYSLADGLGGEKITQLMSGEQGALLASTVGGTSRFDGAQWRTYRMTNVPASNSVNSIAVGPDGSVWAAHAFGSNRLSRFDGTRWRYYSSADGVMSDTTIVVARDREGNIWTAGMGGLSRFDGTTWRTLTPDTALRTVQFGTLAFDSSGNVWTSTRNGRLYRFDGTSWTSYAGPAVSQGFGTDLSALCIAPDGSLWCAARLTWISHDSAGLYHFDGTNWTVYGVQTGYATTEGANMPLAMASDRDGSIWIGYASYSEHQKFYVGGVSRFDGTNWTHYRPRAELAATGVNSDPINGFNSIFRGSDGTLWMGTSGGGVLSLKDGVWKQYTELDGLVNDMVTSVIPASDGSLWCGTTNGISRGASLATSGVGVKEAAAAGTLELYPNPLISQSASAGLTVRFGTVSGGYTRLALYNSIGERVCVLHDGTLTPDQLYLARTTLAVPPGAYYLQLETSGSTLVRQFSVVR